MKPHIAIILLNWNGWKDTIECLESLFRIKYPNYSVIIIDNGSKDQSIANLRKYCHNKCPVQSPFFRYDSTNKPIEIFELDKAESENGVFNKDFYCTFPSNRRLILIKNNKNYGFAEGNNIGIRFALRNLDVAHVLLLNNDTVVDGDFLTELKIAAEKNPDCGFFGPKTYYYDYNGRHDIINFAGGILDIWRAKPHHIGYNQMDTGQFDCPRLVDYVEGSCMLMTKNTIKTIGLLDSSFFAYWEENDLCYRGKKHDIKSYYVPKSKIWHKESASIESAKKIYFLTRNRFFFMRKNANFLQKTVFFLYFFLFQFWVLNLNYGLRHRDIAKIKSFYRGILSGLGIIKDEFIK